MTINKEELLQLKDLLKKDDLPGFKKFMDSVKDNHNLSIEDLDTKYLNRNKNSLLLFLSKNNGFDITAYLLDNSNLEIDYSDKSGNTPLFLWCHERNKTARMHLDKTIPIINSFIEKKASLYKRGGGESFPLLEILNNSDISNEIVSNLIKSDRPVFWGMNLDSRPLPVYAIQKNILNEDLIKEIFDFTPDHVKETLLYDIEDSNNNIIYNSLIHSNISASFCDYLISNADKEKLKDVAIFDKNENLSKTLLMASLSDRKKVDMIIKKNISDINLINEREDTALIMSLLERDFDMADHLIKNGAALFSKNSKNKDALDEKIEEIKYFKNQEFYDDIIGFIESNKESILINEQLNKLPDSSINTSNKKRKAVTL